MRQKSLAGAGTIRIARVNEHPQHHLRRGVVQRDAISTNVRLLTISKRLFACEGGAISTTTSCGVHYYDLLGENPLHRARHDCDYVGKTGWRNYGT
jgi:hypothetical protein